MRALGHMLAFEAIGAASLWLLGKVAPELKQQAEQELNAQLAAANPELAEQLEQLEQNGSP
jgi:hypothetical protein